VSASPVARELGVAACHACGLVSHLATNDEGLHCPRCHAPLQYRKRNSIHRTWAFLLAAIILYIPANVLPIMRTATFFGAQDDTILSGVVALWQAGSWDLAIIVFVASIVVPVMKIAVLMLLLITVQRGSRWRQRERARLYRIVEFVGHWSMLDVFVVALLVALVHFKTFAEVLPGGGAVAFAAVVVLTMLASQSFDPRLIWDAPESSSPATDPSP
jgi:paraquat-inducible protein A